MKKILSFLLASMLISAISVSTFATEINEDSNPQTADTEITTVITPTYVISIPDKTTINFGDTETVLGTVKATHMQIEPNYCVMVSAAAGELQNGADIKNTLQYKLISGTEEFKSHCYTDTVEKTELKIAITEDDWNSAMGGSYKGIITFTVSYSSIMG